MVDNLRGDLRNQQRLRELLNEATGLEAVAEDRPGTLTSAYVQLTGARTTQRLSLQALGTGLSLCTWPGETKKQAMALYQVGRIRRLLRFLSENRQSWMGHPDVHLAYWSARPRDMLYLTCHLDVDEYARQWLRDDLDQLGEHERDRVLDTLWPWLLKRGYAHPDDRQRLHEFLPLLGERLPWLRASIALTRLWTWEEAIDLNRADKLAVKLCATAADVLSALDEPLPPACRPSGATASREPHAAGAVTREALEDVLLDRAAWTHSRLTNAHEHGIQLQEETVTESLLLDISMALPLLTVKTFTRHQESRNGADWQWEWWFEGQRWFGLRIQAKLLRRLRSGRLGYDLDYKSGKRRQIDLLMRDAEESGMQAAYVLYNGPALDLAEFDWGCPRLPPKPNFFGVSLLPASIALDLVNTGHDDRPSVCSASRPWSCLASCEWPGCRAVAGQKELEPTGARADRGDLAQLAALSYERMESLARDYLRERLQLDTRRRDAQTNAPELDTPPTYVTAMLDLEDGSDIQLPPRVGGVTVFRTASS